MKAIKNAYIFVSYIWMGFNLVGIGLLGILSALSPGRRYRVDAFLLRFNLNEIKWQSALYVPILHKEIIFELK